MRRRSSRSACVRVRPSDVPERRLGPRRRLTRTPPLHHEPYQLWRPALSVCTRIRPLPYALRSISTDHGASPDAARLARTEPEWNLRIAGGRPRNDERPCMQGLSGVAGAGFEPATFGL